ncbi:MAG: hypothetical protein ABL907_18485 [Hyphomicrobium sp.]
MNDYKLSEDADYLAHADYLMNGDYAGAIGHLEKTLGRARSSGAIMTASLLLKVIGTMYHFANKRTEAEAAFAAADRESGQSPQIRFFIVSFYDEHGEDRDAALHWLRQILEPGHLTSLDQSDCSEEEMKYRRYYTRKAAEMFARLIAPKES